MVIKLYISGISGNKEVKKKQQRVQMILDSKQINYEAIDITEPGKEKDKEFMQQNGKVRESLGKYPLPPQIFNDDDFCGDYEDFDMANEVDELEKFLHIETNSKDMENGSKNDEKSENINGEYYDDKKKDSADSLYNPYEYHTFSIKCDSVNGLKEEITNINILGGEKEQIEEVTKSEVNGESETVPTLEPSNEVIAENVETLGDDVLAPEEEESTTKETAAENEKEENAGPDEDKEREVEEMPEKEKEEEEKEEEENEKNEDVENEKEDKVESSEKSPLSEEEGEEEEEEEIIEGTEKEKIAAEEDEKKEDEQEESDRESPESEVEIGEDSSSSVWF